MVRQNADGSVTFAYTVPPAAVTRFLDAVVKSHAPEAYAEFLNGQSDTPARRATFVDRLLKRHIQTLVREYEAERAALEARRSVAEVDLT